MQNKIKNTTNILCSTLQKKNRDYGNSFKEQYDEYGLTSVLIRLDDKMKRLKNLNRHTTVQQVLSESIEDTLLDLAGYALLGLICTQDKQQSNLNINFEDYIKPPLDD